MFDHCVSDKVRVDILPLCHKCQHALVTTILGTYQVSGNRYTTETTSAAASMNTTSMPIPDAVGLNQAGTWSRAGDVLTLDPVGSSVTVLKRK